MSCTVRTGLGTPLRHVTEWARRAPALMALALLVLVPSVAQAAIVSKVPILTFGPDVPAARVLRVDTNGAKNYTELCIEISNAFFNDTGVLTLTETGGNESYSVSKKVIGTKKYLCFKTDTGNLETSGLTKFEVTIPNTPAPVKKAKIVSGTGGFFYFDTSTNPSTSQNGGGDKVTLASVTTGGSPTLSEWGMIGMAVLLGFAGWKLMLRV